MFGAVSKVKQRINQVRHSIFERLSMPEPKNIEVLVWDFDGTLYESESLFEVYQNAYFTFIQKQLKRKITFADFLELSDKNGSWSKAASVLLNLPEIKVNSLVNATVDKIAHIKPDSSIVNLLQKLEGYTHIILTNSRENEVLSGLQKIGFKRTKKGIRPFVKIFSADTGVIKPNRDSFLQVTAYTQLPAHKHLMIGDSQAMDIEPAKALGFHALHVSKALPYLQKQIL